MMLIIWMLAALLALAACGGSQMPPPEVMRSLVQEVRAEAEGHVTEPSTALSLHDVRDVTAHDTITDMTALARVADQGGDVTTEQLAATATRPLSHAHRADPVGAPRQLAERQPAHRIGLDACGV